jgi:hypothetical protein
VQFGFGGVVLAWSLAHENHGLCLVNGRHHESTQRHFLAGRDQVGDIEFAFGPVDFSRRACR